ncbi:hypothetical protein M8J76_006531 [Diaphorina citri]|nr:hypothetical protein M8J75_004838 [Diaphorina citri]KAI5722298.1 hypothetical protein M8J76_006531 [Diaphorina citri]
MPPLADESKSSPPVVGVAPVNFRVFLPPTRSNTSEPPPIVFEMSDLAISDIVFGKSDLANQKPSAKIRSNTSEPSPIVFGMSDLAIGDIVFWMSDLADQKPSAKIKSNTSEPSPIVFGMSDLAIGFSKIIGIENLKSFDFAELLICVGQKINGSSRRVQIVTVRSIIATTVFPREVDVDRYLRSR